MQLKAPVVPSTPLKFDWHAGQFVSIVPYLVAAIAAVFGIVFIRRVTSSAEGKGGLIGNIAELILVAAALASLTVTPTVRTAGIWVKHLLQDLTSKLGVIGANITIFTVGVAIALFFAWRYTKNESKRQLLWMIAFGLVVLVLSSYSKWVADRINWLIYYGLSWIWSALLYALQWIVHWNFGVSGVASQVSSSVKWNWVPGVFPAVPTYLLVPLGALAAVLLLRRLSRGKEGAVAIIADVFELLFVASAVASLNTVPMVRALTLWVDHMLHTLTRNLGIPPTGGNWAVGIVGGAVAIVLGIWYHKRNPEKKIGVFATILFGILVAILATYFPPVETVFNWTVRYVLSFAWYTVNYAAQAVLHFSLPVHGN